MTCRSVRFVRNRGCASAPEIVRITHRRENGVTLLLGRAVCDRIPARDCRRKFVGDVAVASRPASLSVVCRAQGALVSVYGAKAFAHPLAALQLLLQGRGPRPDLCFTSFADEFAAIVEFVIPPALWARVV